MPRLLLLFLLLIAAFHASRVLREPRPDADRPVDFRTCYVGQEVLRRGENPYDDATLQAGWQRITQREHLASRTRPGLPNLPFLYPPWAAALLGVSVGQLPYAVAWPLWYALALLSLALLAGLWPGVLRAEAAPELIWWQLSLFALALKGTVPALLTGQPTFAALALGVGALAVAGGFISPPAPGVGTFCAFTSPPDPLSKKEGTPVQRRRQSLLSIKFCKTEVYVYPKFISNLTGAPSFLERGSGGEVNAQNVATLPPTPLPLRKEPDEWRTSPTGRPLLAGLLLGLAAFKVTLLLPFIAWFLWQKHWLALAVAAAVVALLSALAGHWATFPADLLPTYQHLLAQVRAQSFDPADPDYPLTQGLTLRLELGNVLEWLRPGSSAAHPGLHGALWLAALIRLAWLGRQGQRLAGWYVFLVVGTLTLLTTYHLYYDAVLLLPLLAFARRLPRRGQGLLLLALLPLLLPLNGIARALGNPMELRFLYFLPPLGLLGVLALLLARPVVVGHSAYPAGITSPLPGTAPPPLPGRGEPDDLVKV